VWMNGLSAGSEARVSGPLFQLESDGATTMMFRVIFGFD
jgi:hypothetical protein